jgi:magnesium chelatase subunit I
MGSKIELEGFEENKEDHIIDDLIRKAVLDIFNQHFPISQLDAVVAKFPAGFSVETSELMPAGKLVSNLKAIPGLQHAVKQIADSDGPESVAASTEFILEGLHLNKRLNKTLSNGETVYRS